MEKLADKVDKTAIINICSEYKGKCECDENRSGTKGKCVYIRKEKRSQIN